MAWATDVSFEIWKRRLFRRAAVIKDERLCETALRWYIQYNWCVCVCARFFRHTAATAYRKWEQIFMTNDKSRTSLQKQTPHFVCSLIYILFGWRFFFLMRSSVAVSHLSWFSSFLSIPFGLCTRLSILTVKWIHFFWLSNWMHCSGFHFYELTILISDVKCHVVWQCHLQRAYLILILVYNMWCLLYLCIC